jgi:phenylacetate-CoA ligase
MTMTPRSSVSDVVWPAIVTDEGSTLLATAFQLQESQWWSAQDLQDHQFWQLAALLRHARETVPWYQKQLGDAGLTDEQALTPEGWLRVPLLTRRDLQHHSAEFMSRLLPPGHIITHRNKTSGSTGESLEVVCTQVTGFFWQSLAFRDDLWHQRDFSGCMVAIRSGRYKADPMAVHDLPSWGPISHSLYRSGPMTLFYHLTPLPRQVELLEARSPHYLLTYPSNARALCRYSRKRKVRLPNLQAVHTYGEPITPDVRAACRETWGVPVQDVYSCEELGFIALQCPQHEHYHVQSESVLVEILDEQGQPCSPGQIGRVVLTSLHNFAMPIIRYAIGDYAEVGPPCPCGRGLPVLTKILGRRRNRVVLPDGRVTWPNIGEIWAAIPDVDQIQLAQIGSDHVEVRFARQQPLSPSEEHAIRGSIRQALGHPFRLTFRGHETIARQANGKYETFFDTR